MSTSPRTWYGILCSKNDGGVPQGSAVAVEPSYQPARPTTYFQVFHGRALSHGMYACKTRPVSSGASCCSPFSTGSNPAWAQHTLGAFRKRISPWVFHTGCVYPLLDFDAILLTTPRLSVGSLTGRVGTDGCYVAWSGLGGGQGGTRPPPDTQIDEAMVACRE